MADTLARWTASMGARLLSSSSTGEASGLGGDESSHTSSQHDSVDHEDVSMLD